MFKAKTWTQTLVLVAGLASGTAFNGCELLTGSDSGFSVPNIDLSQIQLASAPSVGTIAAFYCPEIPGGVLTDIACTTAFGARPPESELAFFFDLNFDAGNNGSVPIPVTDMLVAFDVFDGQAEQALGTTCVTFCEAGSADCNTNPGPDACAANPGDVGPDFDLTQAVPDLLFATLSGGVNGLEDNLRVRTIPAGSTIDINITFGLGVNAMVDLVSGFGVEAAQSFLNSGSLELDIPVKAQGNLFVDVPLLNRVTVPFGPVEQTWNIK